MVTYFILGGGDKPFYDTLLNDLNEKEIKIKTSQKRFSACHRDQGLPSFLYIARSKYSKVGSHMKGNGK